VKFPLVRLVTGREKRKKKDFQLGNSDVCKYLHYALIGCWKH